jgi:hypothetical protein
MRAIHRNFIKVILSWSLVFSTFGAYRFAVDNYPDYIWICIIVLLLIVHLASKLRPDTSLMNEVKPVVKVHYGWCILVVVIAPLIPWSWYYMDIYDIEIPIYLKMIGFFLTYLAFIVNDLRPLKSRDEMKLAE